MQGDIIKIHSDFYYARVGNSIFECKIREKLKKEKIEVAVGDKAEINIVSEEENQAVIVDIVKRKNFIPRPFIANIDQIITVASLNNPKLDFTQLDRYLIQAKHFNIPAIICINKADIEDKKNLKDKAASIYDNLGYKIIFTSALTGEGIEELKKVLNSRRTVFCGLSGVGKSSLINKLNPGLSLKTKQVSSKTRRGTHATRHVELMTLDTISKNTEVADTPGFSYLKFDTMMPETLINLFDDIKAFSAQCYYSDCLHIREDGCNVLENIDKIAPSRYLSYKVFVSEALEYKERLSMTGHKEEESYKTIDKSDKGKIKIVKIKVQKREESRKTGKQKLNLVSILDDAYYNNEEDSD